MASPLDHRELNLETAGITAVVWATGFRYDFGWVQFPIFTATRGEPIQRRGVTDVAGLSFLGLRLLYKVKSSLMAGVGEDAAFLAEHIATRT